eukprot:12427112-Karenia_brevis.AAC.1
MSPAPLPCHELRYHVTSSAAVSLAPLPCHELHDHVTSSAAMSPAPLPCHRLMKTFGVENQNFGIGNPYLNVESP